jgi:hypothetical protein
MNTDPALRAWQDAICADETSLSIMVQTKRRAGRVLQNV